MKKVTVEEAAEFLGFEKVGRFYYCILYANGYNGYSGLPFGLETVYLGDDEWADPSAYTRKQILMKYEEFITENPEDALLLMRIRADDERESGRLSETTLEPL